MLGRLRAWLLSLLMAELFGALSEKIGGKLKRVGGSLAQHSNQCLLERLINSAVFQKFYEVLSFLLGVFLAHLARVLLL